MPLHDLSPELRTRLSRVERMVGWFVLLAAVLLLAGFGYYIYVAAQSRGWFVTKVNYATALNDASGLKIGNPVKLMGFDVGEITQINLNSPETSHGITVFFSIRDPYYGYISYDSHVQVISDILGNRFIEVTKGEYGAPSVTTNKSGKLIVLNRYVAWKKYQSLTNEMARNPKFKSLTKPLFLTAVTNELMGLLTNKQEEYYTNVFEGEYNKPILPDRPGPLRNYYFIVSLDTPSLSDRLGSVADELEAALPNILSLTNQLEAVLSNANSAVAKLDRAIAKTDPILTNLDVITGNLREPNGSLGKWIIPTNIEPQLRQTLQSATLALRSAHTTMDSADTNITMLADDLDKTLEHLADITSNLNSQVQMNTNLISNISTTIVHTDQFIQGLKHFWLLRSAFKHKKPEKHEPLPAVKP